ncbi:NACHT domain-containing NTPase [Streptomyces sp. NBC_00154]|uniref:NACHT domain-containing protein n=1 Tax=Streptomyces sp. NBC_00154 TaxID=2975670 RepID=UPI002256F135|nr:NACHT domain-containing protein [Streptomyces sp. NBC_00154]MCX5318070.1 NACHT domain-containing protein [Streptomyces sp. NBC_00154]
MEEPAGRQALAAQLGQLHAELRELRQPERTQKAAVEEANRRRRTAAGRPKDVPWPRKESGADLSPQTVNDWFPKQRGSKEPSVPQDFDDLWSMVAVMLEWTGQLRDKPSVGRLRHHWYKLHEDAQRGTSLDEEVRGYLEAVWKAAQQHPYPGIPGQIGPPSLPEVYVRQRSRPVARDGHVPRDGSAAEPAEAVFLKADRLCVLIAGPGGGKSTLLRTWLRDAASVWLGSTQTARKSSPAVPIWVSARALAGEETQVPDALAAATRKLSRYGRHPELTRARFLERPCTGAHWQVLVDDLDELPNADERCAVLQKLANAVTQDPPLYRCVVATRPLTENELNVLGGAAPHYELQPFTTDDLRTYVEKYFSTRWPQEEATRRAHQFTGALRDASLVELARTPLMVFMLCQLYLADPERPLPDGRTAVYEAFTDLLYENNQNKRVADSHEEAIQRLAQQLQSPRARKATDAAARQVHERLPELIDYLAHQSLTGQQIPVTEALASHEAVHCPDRVRPKRWETFLEDLLRHTGLLVHHADGLGFPHQTFLEYHAARHATRDEQARAELLDELFPPGQSQVPATEPSYLGFLLDALLTCPGGMAAETTNRIEALTRQAGERACGFLVEQVALRTSLRTAPTARQLTRFAQDKAFDGWCRVLAAKGLAGVNGYRDRAAQLLAQLANDVTLHRSARVWAARELAGVEGYRDAGADRLIALANDTTFDSFYRVRAVRELAGVEGYRDAGAQLFTQLADDTTLDSSDRVRAARKLAGVEGYRDAGAQLFTQLADDTTLDSSDRVRAARKLAEVEGYRDAGADRLIALADDTTTFGGFDRVRAARKLAEVDGYQDAGADRLIALANDTTTFDGSDRVWVAANLAGVEGYRDRAAQLLAQLANDVTLHRSARVWAAEHLAGVEGYRDAGADRLIAFADDTTFDGSDRVWAARKLAEVEGYRDAGADRLIAFADDATTFGGF